MLSGNTLCDILQQTLLKSSMQFGEYIYIFTTDENFNMDEIINIYSTGRNALTSRIIIYVPTGVR